MPTKSGRLAQQEQVFIEKMAATGDKVYSAKAAGYAQPSRDAGRTLARPAVQAEIARLQVERLFTEALPAAVTCLIDLIKNDKAPAGARVQAAKVVMDRTIGSSDAQGNKEAHEMTGEELARAIDELTRVAADRAKVVSIEAPVELDIFG